MLSAAVSFAMIEAIGSLANRDGQHGRMHSYRILRPREFGGAGCAVSAAECVGGGPRICPHPTKSSTTPTARQALGLFHQHPGGSRRGGAEQRAPATGSPAAIA